MKISIYSLEKALFEGEAEKLIAETSLGQITVLDHHLPLITSITGPAVRVVKKDKEEIVPLAGGFLEVRPESEAVILAN